MESITRWCAHPPARSSEDKIQFHRPLAKSTFCLCAAVRGALWYCFMPKTTSARAVLSMMLKQFGTRQGFSPFLMESRYLNGFCGKLQFCITSFHTFLQPSSNNFLPHAKSWPKRPQQSYNRIKCKTLLVENFTHSIAPIFLLTEIYNLFDIPTLQEFVISITRNYFVADW